MIAAVFDCMAFLQAAAKRKGPAGACFTLVEEGHVDLFVSAAILEEVREVLHRPGIRKAFRNLSDEVVQEFLEHVVDKAHVVMDVPNVYRLERDRDDEPYLNLAIAAQAAFLVSRDKDLLELMKNDDFRTAYPGLTILDPPAFLAHVRSEVSKKLGNE